jgi:pyroglutamyl-peptidase
VRFLLTAFEPFDGTGLNAGLEGCRAFLDRCGSALDLRFAVLPVEYGRDTDAVERALGEGPVDVLLHTGQASHFPQVRVERVAVNLRYPDGAVRAHLRQPIEKGGPERLLSTLPVDGIAGAIQAEGIPAVVSDNAGIYLCNHVFYQSLRREERVPTGARVSFLHVPGLPQQVGEAGMEAKTIARAIHATLRFLVDQQS